jgi:Protein of unknown function (DUF2846)
MLKSLTAVLVAIVSLTACAIGPTAQQTQAVRIEGTPGAGVVYLLRSNPDLSYLPATVTVDGRLIGTTYAGTYIRMELPAGRHRLSGYAVDSGAIDLDVQPGRVYFVHQTVAGSWRSPSSMTSFFRLIDEQRARGMMVGSTAGG